MVKFYYGDSCEYPHINYLKKLSGSVTNVGPKLFVD